MFHKPGESGSVVLLQCRVTMAYKPMFAVFLILLIERCTLAQTVTGKATYYNPDGGTGSCGTVIQNSDMEAALG